MLEKKSKECWYRLSNFFVFLQINKIWSVWLISVYKCFLFLNIFIKINIQTMNKYTLLVCKLVQNISIQIFIDSIEIERSADTERRLSLTLKSSDDIQNRILRDVTEQSLPNSAKKCQSPGTLLMALYKNSLESHTCQLVSFVGHHHHVDILSSTFFFIRTTAS